MTMHYNTMSRNQQLPHIPFGHVLKKACMQQEQTMQNLEMHVYEERVCNGNLRQEVCQVEEETRKWKML